jgi:hypothetical protein
MKLHDRVATLNVFQAFELQKRIVFSPLLSASSILNSSVYAMALKPWVILKAKIMAAAE